MVDPEGGNRANATNTLRIWDMLDDVVALLSTEEGIAMSPAKPRVRQRKRKERAEVSGPDDDDEPLPSMSAKMPEVRP
jgi:hypothetical protein